MSYMKQMQEQKDAKIKEMNDIVSAAKTENRAMTEEEQTKFDALEKEIEGIDKSIEMEKRAIALGVKKKEGTEDETVEQKEERAFANFIMDVVENRADGINMTAGSNGAIIPTSIANRIIKEVKDRCPILARATVFHVKGTLKVPVYGADESGNNITVAFSEDFTELTANAGKFTSVDLGGFLMGALTLLGRQLENNSVFNVTAFVVSQMAEEISLFLEGKLLNGESGKLVGALSTKNVVTAGAATAIEPDELVKVQATVKQAFQKDACWIMHPETFLGVKLMKDANERYLLQDDITGEFPYRLLGKPVFISDNMPKLASGAKAILYGDMKGLGVNIRENLEVQVLREKYATMHALGVVAWMEVDSKVIDHQRLAVLKMA